MQAVSNSLTFLLPIIRCCYSTYRHQKMAINRYFILYANRWRRRNINRYILLCTSVKMIMKKYGRCTLHIKVVRKAEEKETFSNSRLVFNVYERKLFSYNFCRIYNHIYSRMPSLSGRQFAKMHFQQWWRGKRRQKKLLFIHNYAHKFMTPKDISRHNHRSSDQRQEKASLTCKASHKCI